MKETNKCNKNLWVAYRSLYGKEIALRRKWLSLVLVGGGRVVPRDAVMGIQSGKRMGERSRKYMQ